MPTERLLFVDHDPELLSALAEKLGREVAIDIASTGAELSELVGSAGPYALALVGRCEVGGDVLALLDIIRQRTPETVRILLVDSLDQQTAIAAVNEEEVFHFVERAASVDRIFSIVRAGLERHRLRQAEHNLLESTLAGSIKMLSDILGLAAPSALGRGQHLRDSMARFARHVQAKPRWELEMAALLAEIGNAALPPLLFNKIEAGVRLRPEEASICQRVPQIGHDLIADIPRLAGVADIVLYQHKHFDGGGFPVDSVSGQAIPLGARMLKILHDRFELEADGIVKQRALEVMRAREGTYDPDLLAQCFICFGDFLVSAIAADRPVRALLVRELNAGQVVVSDIVTPEGVNLVSAGHRLTDATLQRLRNFAELGEVKEPLLVQDSSLEAAPAAI